MSFCVYDNTTGQTATEYQTMGLSKWLTGDYQGALKDFEKQISLNGEDSEGYANKALALKSIEKYTEAIYFYTIAIEKNPKALHYYKYRGEVKTYIYDYWGAVADFSKIIEKEPNNSDALLIRGQAKMNLNDFDEALKDFNRIIQIPVTIKDGKRYFIKATAYFYRGIMRINRGDKNGGCLDLSKAGEMGYSDAYKKIEKYCFE